MSVGQFLLREFHLWRNARIAKIPLGKYIVLFAAALNLGWSALLFIDPDLGGATPLHILVMFFGGPIPTAIILVLAAASGLTYIRIRAVSQDWSEWLPVLLLPQMVLLWMSAVAGILAVLSKHYADGTIRPWPFILADQLPVMLLALLYTATVVETVIE